MGEDLKVLAYLSYINLLIDRKLNKNNYSHNDNEY